MEQTVARRIDDVDISRAIKAEMGPELDKYPTTRITIRATKKVDDARKSVKLDGVEDLNQS